MTGFRAGNIEEAVLMLNTRTVLFALGSLALTLALVLHSRTATGQAAQPTTEIKVDNFTFSPETLTVPANSTVTWTNKDDVPHVIASTEIGRASCRERV